MTSTTISVDVEDVLAFHKETLVRWGRPRRRRAKVVYVVPAALLVAALISWLRGHTTSVAVEVAIAAFWLLLVPPLFDKWRMRNARRQVLEEKERMLGAVQLDLGEEALVIRSPRGEGTYPWSGLPRPWENDDYLFLLVSRHNGLPICRAKCGKKIFDELRAALIDRVGFPLVPGDRG